LVLIAATYLGQDDSQPMVAKGSEPQPSFQVFQVNTLAGGIDAGTMVSVSDLLFDQMGTPVRVIATATMYSRGGVVLSQNHQMQTLIAASDTTIDIQGGSFFPGLSKAIAAEHLGETDQETFEAYLDAEAETAVSPLRVRPAKGQIWGTVLMGQDVIVETAPGS